MVLPYINMIPPWVYTCSQSWTPLPPPPHTIPLDRLSAPAPSFLYPALNLDWQFISYMILYIFQCHSPKSSPTSLSHRVQRLFFCFLKSFIFSPKLDVFRLFYWIGSLFLIFYIYIIRFTCYLSYGYLCIFKILHLLLVCGNTIGYFTLSYISNFVRVPY